MASRPSQKCGTDSPIRARPLAAHSDGRPRRTAATTPAPIPSTAAMSMASTDSSTVTGSAVREQVRTGMPVRIDVPKSPVRLFFT